MSDCSYHALNGGGDSNPGYDVILMKKGMLDIQREAREHLEHLDYENPDDLDKIYFYKSIIDTTEGVMIYARRMSEYAAELASRESDPKRKAELLKISEVNARVPAHAPSSFWEAIQSVWTVESLLPGGREPDRYVHRPRGPVHVSFLPRRYRRRPHDRL